MGRKSENEQFEQVALCFGKGETKAKLFFQRLGLHPLRLLHVVWSWSHVHVPSTLAGSTCLQRGSSPGRVKGGRLQGSIPGRAGGGLLASQRAARRTVPTES